MSPRWRLVSAIGAAVGASVAVAACGGSSSQTGVIQVGAVAPAYATTKLGGDSVSLAALRGKVVLLNVWATWCHPCRAEIPAVQALHVKFRDQGLEVIGVSVDVGGMDDGIRSFMAEFQMTYSVWLDPDERVSAQFRTIGVPETFLIDRAGVLRWHKIGPIQHGDSTLAIALSRALGT